VIVVGYVSYVGEVVSNDVLVADDRSEWSRHGRVVNAQREAQARLYPSIHPSLEMHSFRGVFSCCEFAVTFEITPLPAFSRLLWQNGDAHTW